MIRLVVVLALVLVLMREAGKPAAYELFFPSTPQKVTLLDSTKESSSVVSSAASPVPSFVEVQQFAEAARSWAAKQTTDVLSATLADWLRGEPFHGETFLGEPSFVEPSFVEPANSGDANPSADGDSWAKTGAGSIAGAIAIQNGLIDRAKDGTVWRAADTPGLMATLAMHDASGPRFSELRTTAFLGEVAGVLPLLQQPDFYRGQNVTARGDLVRIERIEAPSNAFLVERYWNLWLMPEDASARPWLVIIAELPAQMSGLIKQVPDPPEGSRAKASAGASDPAATNATWSIKTPYPRIRVNGEFIKRLTYQSQNGAELTPVVAGHIESIGGNGNPLITVSAETRRGLATGSELGKSTASPWAIVIAAVVLGALFSGWIMWRTKVLNRQLRQRRQRRPVVFKAILTLGLGGGLMGANAQAQSVMDLLPGWSESQLQEIATRRDGPSLDSVDSPGGVDSIESLDGLEWDRSRLAKLVYRFNRLDDAILKERRQSIVSPKTNESPETNDIGDGVSIDGTVLELKTLRVPEALTEVLEFQTITAARLRPNEGRPMVVAFGSLPVRLQVGDRLNGSGARIGKLNEADIFVAGRLAWTPRTPTSPAASVLARSGVDLSRLNEIAARDRQPLTATDSFVFFKMIGAARNVVKTHPQETTPSDLPDDPTTNPSLDQAIALMRSQVIAASPIDLLQSPNQFTAQWISLEIETVRITRVAVESQQRQGEVGSPFYYQLDAIGDLGNVQLKIEVPDGEPVEMENRYPVTVVTAELPEFLRQGQGEDWVSTQSLPIRVEGFYYRLWSYESDFMKARGGKQFAPLIIGGVIEDRRPATRDPIGVGVIGKIATIGVLAGIVAVFVFGIVTRRGDRISRNRRV